MDELRGLIVGWDWMIECGPLWCVCVVYVSSLVFDLVEWEWEWMNHSVVTESKEILLIRRYRWMMSYWLLQEICPMYTGYPSISGFWEKYYYSFYVYCNLVRTEYKIPRSMLESINQIENIIDVVVACWTPVGHRSNIYNNSTRMGMWPCSLIDIVNIIYIVHLKTS